MANNECLPLLNKVLADTYALYLKTQCYHWHVTGPNFHSLHEMFEEQYLELAAAVDALAEGIRTHAAPAASSFKEFIALTCISDGNVKLAAEAMVKDLASDQDKILATLNKALLQAQNQHAEGDIHLLSDRVSVHEKNKWMLLATLG